MRPSMFLFYNVVNRAVTIHRRNEYRFDFVLNYQGATLGANSNSGCSEDSWSAIVHPLQSGAVGHFSDVFADTCLAGHGVAFPRSRYGWICVPAAMPALFSTVLAASSCCTVCGLNVSVATLTCKETSLKIFRSCIVYYGGFSCLNSGCVSDIKNLSCYHLRMFHLSLVAL